MTDLQEMGKKAVCAKYLVQKLNESQKNQALNTIAEHLVQSAGRILAANEKDIARGEANGMHPGLIDRLRLTSDRIQSMADGLKEIALLPEPIGEILEDFTRPNGLHIQKVRVPMGVIGIIYESRPNVTADAFGLCFKSGNAVILKGGSDALDSNLAITACIRESLEQAKITSDAIQFIPDTDRQVTLDFMKLNGFVDVLIPRGGAGLIRSVVAQSTIPVIETGTGNCHIYVDETADIQMAVSIIINAKTQRIGVCNACESLVVHEAALAELLPPLTRELEAYSVEIRADEPICAAVPHAKPATQEDFGKEYLDYILSMKTVSNIDEAIAHINRYNTGHSEAIITSDKENARKFEQEVDAACVYVNASTRFTDGFEFGFGAEIGISTQKLHARGPMGLKELTSYKYTINGSGQTR